MEEEQKTVTYTVKIAVLKDEVGRGAYHSPQGSNGTEIYGLRQRPAFKAVPSPRSPSQQRPHGVPRPYVLQKHIALVVSMATGLCNGRARETARSPWVTRR